MKKILLPFVSLLAFNAVSQTPLTLTKAGQEPVAGDISNIQYYDSVGVIPKSTGTNQNWNFSSISQTTDAVQSTTYVTAASVPASSLFPGATVVASDGPGSYGFYKSSSSPTSKFEYLGFVDLSFTPLYGINAVANPETRFIWPMSAGTTFTDSYVFNDIGNNIVYNGTQTISVSGSGTITMPNGTVYNNIVQVKTSGKEVVSVTFSNTTVTFTSSWIYYDYFHPTQKFQLLRASYYFDEDGTYYDLKVFSPITVGIKSAQFDNSFSLFPNPTKDNINLKLDNLGAEAASVEIFDLTGKKILSKELGKNVKINETLDLGHLEKGIYVLKTILGAKSQATKLVIE